MSITDNYFTPIEYPHNFAVETIVDIYTYISNQGGYAGTLSGITGFSYTADVSADVRQSASITFYSAIDDKTWYMRRENLMYQGYDEDTHQYTAIMWTPLLYKIRQRFTNSDGSTNEINFGYFMPISDSYSYSTTTGEVSMNLVGCSSCFKEEYGGGLIPTKIGIARTDPLTHEESTVYYPRGIQVAKNQSLDATFFEYFTKKNGYYLVPSMYEMPINNTYISNFDISQTVKTYQFENGVATQEVIDTICTDSCQNYCSWIDENMNHRICRKSPIGYGSYEMNYKDYSNLVIDEETTYDDSNVFSCVEVYGKDGLYYDYCDWTCYTGQTKKQTLSVSELTSNNACYQRAVWECYKNLYGHEKTNVSLVGCYIPAFNCPSLIIGQPIEYRSLNGATNVYTLNSLSYSDNKWTMALSIFRPLYTDEKTSISPSRKQSMLSKPIISNHIIADGKIKFYITGDDINISLVKMYSAGISFCGETVTTETIDGVEYKVFTMDLDGRSEYTMKAQFYNPQRELSYLSDMYTVEMDEDNG